MARLVRLARLADGGAKCGAAVGDGWWAGLCRSLPRLGRSAPDDDGNPPRRSFDNHRVARGDRVEIGSKGQRRCYMVVDVIPDGSGVIDRATEVTIDHRAMADATTSPYDDVGGLAREVALVREMVELPLRFPHVFARLGIEAPKGVLLYGPPGCGKTLIARTVAREAGVYFLHVNGPEIIQKHYGESEEMLRRIFADAQKQPAAIIFFDEIDAIAPNRETVLGDVEKRVVAQLLALMDGLTARGNIVVIAATNLPNSLDPALRRPGRFDREIGIAPPDRAGRLEILRIHTRRMPLADDVDLAQIAAAAHGYLGADLAALCREAAMGCTRDLGPRLVAGDPGAAAALDGDLQVRMDHFRRALREVPLASTRSLTTEVAASHWDEVGGLDDIKALLRETVEWPLKYPQRLAFAKTTAPRGILLTGPTGTGKTLIVRALATQSDVNFIAVNGPELLSKWVGETERAIRDVFRKARQSAPSIIFFDEVDAIVASRGGDDGGARIGDRMVGQFLLEMDGLAGLDGVVVIAATNRPDLIDRALLRPGRFDHIATLALPDRAARAAILAIHCRGRALGSDVDLAALAKACAGMSGADLEALCRRAAMAAIRASIIAEPGADFAPFAITGGDFDAALADWRTATPEGASKLDAVA